MINKFENSIKSALVAFAWMLIFLFLKQMRYVFLQGFNSYEGSETTFLLLKDIRVLEMVLKLSCALDSGVAYLANFNRVKFIPFSLVKILIEISDKLGVNKVNKSIAYVAVILGYRKVTL